MNGKRLGEVQILAWSYAFCLAVLGLLPSLRANAIDTAAIDTPAMDTAAVDTAAVFARTQPAPAGQGQQPEELEQLRAMLQRSGPDGRPERESAVARLLAMARPEAHRLLQEQLLRQEDRDGLRATILDALQSHLLGNPATQFGGAAPNVRSQILTGYLGACAPLWCEPGNAVEDVATAPVRAAARRALQRVPVRELDAAARVLLPAVEPAGQVFVLRCLADMQQTLLARTIADQLDAAEEVVRVGAQRALQLVIYADEPILTKADFEGWHARYGSMRYVDLVERAARIGPRPLERLRDELARLRIVAAREFVAAHIQRTPGIDWSAVQSRTITDDPAVLDACLQALQTTLAQSAQPDGNAAPRRAFCRALLDRFRTVPNDAQPEIQRRRALLLEVAAYLARPEEIELANELRTLLLAELDAKVVTTQIAALRGLRRFPSEEARAALVARAQELLGNPGPNRDLLEATLDTLASRIAPRWMAPAGGAPDKAAWLALVDGCCRSAPELDLRARALVLAQTLDPSDARVPEAFDILLELVNDPTLDTKFRSTALIYLEAWRSDLSERWVPALQELLEDDARELRLQAAESLARLPESVNPRRVDWFKSSLTALRDRLTVEPDAAVMTALVDCIKACGREPQMPEKAIGVLKFALEQIGRPVGAEHQFRLEPLLQALAAIAADPRSDRGQWMAACEPLLANGKRQSLRLVLQSHAAIELAKDVAAADAGMAQRAREAMRLIIEAAVLKAPRTAWTSSEQLLREARDVRAAFLALDTLDAAERLDQTQHRLLRLTVDLAVQKYQDVVRRASDWLAAAPAGGNGGNGGSNGNGNGNGETQPGRDVAYRDQLCVLAAEAQLALGKPDLASKLLEARSASAPANSAVLELSSRVALGLVTIDLTSAVKMLEATMRATAVEDPAFRTRLIDWMRYQIQLDPGSRTATLQEGERHAALFAAVDCPAELRETFEQLRTSR